LQKNIRETLNIFLNYLNISMKKTGSFYVDIY